MPDYTAQRSPELNNLLRQKTDGFIRWPAIILVLLLSVLAIGAWIYRAMLFY